MCILHRFPRWTNAQSIDVMLIFDDDDDDDDDDGGPFCSTTFGGESHLLSPSVAGVTVLFLNHNG